MTGKDDATQVDGRVAEGSEDTKNEEGKLVSVTYDPRKAAMEEAVKGRRASLAAEIAQGGGEVPEQLLDKPEAEDKPPVDKAGDKPEVAEAPEESKARLDVAKQIEKQGEEILLTPEDMKRVKIRTKVDGREVTEDGAKVLASFQKHEAADGRLAQAVEIQREAQRKLDEANQLLADAGSKAETKAAEKAVAAAQAGIDETVAKVTQAFFEGDSETAASLLKQAITSGAQAVLAARGPEPAKLDEAKLFDRVVEQVERHQTVSSALKQLDKDYPQIRQDPAIARLADAARVRFEGEGLSREDAIAKAGEYVARAEGLIKADDPVATPKGEPTPTSVSTTREARLDAKRALSEPKSASVRAISAPAAEATASSKIDKMRAARGQLF